jgi:hypothetical protein
VHGQQRRCAGVVGVAAIHQPRHPFAVGPPRLDGASRRDKGETRTVQHRLPDRNACSPRIGPVLIARGRDAIEDRLTRADARREERSRLDASEAALDALAKPEKRQDREDDDDQADDIDDVVHEVTFVSVKWANRPQAPSRRGDWPITRFNCTCLNAGNLYAGARKSPRHRKRANGRWRIPAQRMRQITPAHRDV